MKTKTSLVFAGILALSSVNVFAQDIHFSQFYESPLTMNPALCGMFKGDVYVELNYKNQWGSVMGSGYGFNTTAAAVELHNLIKKWNHSYLSPGLSVYNDRSGDAKIGMTEINLTLASGVLLAPKSTLAGGLQAGWAQHSVNSSNFEWGSQYNSSISGGYDPSLPGDPMAVNSFSFIDFSGGLAWNDTVSSDAYTKKNLRINAGAAVFHINQPKESYYGNYDPVQSGVKLHMRWVGHALVEYNLPNSNIGIIPSVVYYMQGAANEMDLGIKMRYLLKQDSKYAGFIKGAALDIGGYYRLKDAIIPMIQLEFSNYALGISYDINVSSLGKAAAGAGGFEISLRLLNPNPFFGPKITTHSLL